MSALRWKLLGVFGLSACGFAVLAEPSCQRPMHVAQRQLPELPKVEPVPVPQRAAVTNPSETPVVQLPEIKPFVEPPIVEVRPLIVPEIKPLPLADVKPVPMPKPIPTPVQVQKTQEPLPTYSGPLMSPEKFVEVVKTLPPETKPSVQVIAVPVAVPIPTPMQTPTSPVLMPDARLTVPVTPVAATAKATVAFEQRTLKLNLTLSETQPRLEIRDGDDVLIKCTADQMDVKSGQQKGEVWSHVKATGGVKFMTPGGEGVCSELNLNHATGEIKAINARFTHHWGNVETTVQSDVMTFKLSKQGFVPFAPETR